MSKIPIDEQIEAVSLIAFELAGQLQPHIDDATDAAIKTLEFVRDHQEEIRYAVARKKALAEAKADEVVNRILHEFPGAEIEGVGEAD